MFDFYDFVVVEGGFEKVFFIFKNMIFLDVNFEYNLVVFKLGLFLQFYVDLVKIYFDFNLEASMAIIGYIDSIGFDVYNLDLGMCWAENVCFYFQDFLGVIVSIQIDFEGESCFVVFNFLFGGVDNLEGW